MFDLWLKMFNMCFVYGLGDFSAVWGISGVFQRTQKDKSYAYLPNLARNQMGQNYDGVLV